MYTLHIEFNISEIFLYYFLFTGLSLLSVLNLDKNRLHTLHSSSLKNCTGLQSLSLSHNFLTQVPEAVHHLSNLEILDLSSNLLGVLKRESLQGLPKLKSLKLGIQLFVYYFSTQYTCWKKLCCLFQHTKVSISKVRIELQF